MKIYDVIIIGNGLSGYLLAYNLLKNNYLLKILLVGKEKISNSIISGGEICTRGFNGKSIKTSILENGGFMSDMKLLNLFLDNLDKSLTDFSLDFEVVPSFIGGKFNPYKTIDKIKNILDGRYDFKEGELSYINNIKGIFNNIEIFNGKEIEKCYGKTLVIASGGYGNIFKQNDNVINNYFFNVHGLAVDSGIALRNMEFLMYHPFGKYINSGNIEYCCTKTDTLSNKVLQSSFNKDLSGLKYILDSHNGHQNLSDILKYFYNNGEIKIDNIKYNPVVHYTIGGIDINDKFETNIKNIYSFGEASIGISGASRIGGISFSEIITFSSILGRNLKNYIIEGSFNIIKSDNIYTVLETNKINECKLSIKDILDFSIYGSNEKELLNLLEKIEKLHNCSYKTLASVFIKSMIQRKESIFMFYRRDYKNKSFFLYNLIYKNGKLYKKHINNLLRIKYFFYKYFINF